MEKYCIWQKDIFAIMERKGYVFDHIIVTGCKGYPITYVFKKMKQIAENRFRGFEMSMTVKNDNSGFKWFYADYRLRLQDYSKNKNGYIDGYYGDTPVVVANSFFIRTVRTMRI